MSCCLLVSFLLGQTPEIQEKMQRDLDRIRTLVKVTQERNIDLKKRLEERQQALARQYAEFKLDVKAVEKLQGEILDLQKQLLANYHHMQVELRKIVGPEWFATLRLRLDNVLGVNPAKKAPERK